MWLNLAPRHALADVGNLHTGDCELMADMQFFDNGEILPVVNAIAAEVLIKLSGWYVRLACLIRFCDLIRNLQTHRLP